MHDGGMEKMSLQLQHLSKSYGRCEAVRDLSFCVRRGEIVGLLGPNGAGKSTTIAMLTGFLTPTTGDVRWEGHSIFSELPKWRRQIGVVLEDLCLFEYLSIREHLALIGRLGGLSSRQTEQRTEELLAFFQLDEQAETIAAQASAGTRKKLAFAIALIHAPSVLLLDEATNGIDAVTVSRIKSLLKTLSSSGVAVIMSSHVLDAVESVVERCIIINKGEICLDASVAGIKSSGATLEQAYTATILGPDRTEPVLSWV